MDINLTIGRWDIFLLVLIRITSMVMVAPVLGARSVPSQVKVGLSVLLAILLTPLQPVPPPLFTSWLGTLIAVSREVIVGLLLGFSASVLFSAIQMAAQIVGVQIGFSFSNIIDPVSAQSSGFMETLYNLMATVVFLNLGGHYALLTGLSQSFELAPVGMYGPAPIVGDRLVALSSLAIGIALRLALPVVGTMMLVDVAMALVVRSIPQMNVFAVGLPVKMVVGMLTLVALTPLTISGMASVTQNIAAAVAGVLR